MLPAGDMKRIHMLCCTNLLFGILEGSCSIVCGGRTSEDKLCWFRNLVLGICGPVCSKLMFLQGVFSCMIALEHDPRKNIVLRVSFSDNFFSWVEGEGEDVDVIECSSKKPEKSIKEDHMATGGRLINPILCSHVRTEHPKQTCTRQTERQMDPATTTHHQHPDSVWPIQVVESWSVAAKSKSSRFILFNSNLTSVPLPMPGEWEILSSLHGPFLFYLCFPFHILHTLYLENSINFNQFNLNRSIEKLP